MSASSAYCDRSASRRSGKMVIARSCATARPATCPATSAPTWTYHVVFGEHDRQVRHDMRRPEQVPPATEGIGEERDRELPLEHEQREVVGEHVDERDRHERMEEVARERPRCVHRPASERASGLVGEGDEQDAGEEPAEAQEGDEQLTERRVIDDERALDARREVLPGRRAAVAVEQDRAEHHGDERHRARDAFGPGEAGEAASAAGSFRPARGTARSARGSGT